jgi:hypothetical protein
MNIDPKNFDFNSIRVVGICQLMIQKGESPEVIINSRGSKIDIQFEVRDLELLIYSLPDDDISPDKPIPKITIMYIHIKSIMLTGSIDLYTNNKIAGNTLALILNGTGNINLQVDVVNLDCTIVKSGTIRVFGDTTSSSIMLLGTGIYQGQDLDAGVVSVEIANRGTATVSAENDLIGSITNGGTLYYMGTPCIKGLSIEGNSKMLPLKRNEPTS